MTLEQALEMLGKEWPRTNKIECAAGHQTPNGTPSLHLYEDTDSYYCFSCGANGDAYGLLALFTGRPIGDILHEYQGKAERERLDPVVTRRELLSASYATWLNFLGAWHKEFDEVTDWLPVEERAARKQRALDKVEAVWDGPLDIRRVEGSPAKLDREISEAILELNQATIGEGVNRGLFGPGFQSEIHEPGRPGGERVREGQPSRILGSERVASTESVDEAHVGSDETFARLLQRRLPGRGGGVW